MCDTQVTTGNHGPGVDQASYCPAVGAARRPGYLLPPEPCATAPRCRVEPYWIKAAPAAPLARRKRRALPWGGPPGARRAAHWQRPQIKTARTARTPVQRKAVFLAVQLSRSRPPRLGRSLRSRRMRSASPNLDAPATRQESALIEEDGAEQAHRFAGQDNVAATGGQDPPSSAYGPFG